MLRRASLRLECRTARSQSKRYLIGCAHSDAWANHARPIQPRCPTDSGTYGNQRPSQVMRESFWLTSKVSHDRPPCLTALTLRHSAPHHSSLSGHRYLIRPNLGLHYACNHRGIRGDEFLRLSQVCRLEDDQSHCLLVNLHRASRKNHFTRLS